MTFTVEPIFSVPLFTSNDIYNLNRDEINYIENEVSKEIYMNNQVSIQNSLLDDERMKNISLFIKENMNSYIQHIICPKNPNLEFYISSSWSIYIDKNESFIRQYHSNSKLTGCFIIKSGKDKQDYLRLYKDHPYERIKIPVSSNNIYNNNAFSIEITSGMLILFPSSIEYSFLNNSDIVAIIFNVFVRGDIGKDTIYNGFQIR